MHYFQYLLGSLTSSHCFPGSENFCVYQSGPEVLEVHVITEWVRSGFLVQAGQFAFLSSWPGAHGTKYIFSRAIWILCMEKIRGRQSTESNT